jgi:hydroxymethylpyrimidine pyrophosphatase-like HAD family hydrolase
MKLALLDLDKTLLGVDYRLTVPKNQLHEVVRQLAHKGIEVGLCSDSSILSLRQWHDCLGLTGPLVGERGAVIWHSSLVQAEPVDIKETLWLQNLRGSFLAQATVRFPEITLVVGDATKFIKHRTVFQSMTRNILVVNSFRIASFSFFARQLSNGFVLKKDPFLLEEASRFAEELVVSLGRNRDGLFWDENPEYGILIVHSQSTEKHRGVTFLERNFDYQEIVMVGDSIADYLNLPNVTQFAVGNASVLYKEKCDYVSKDLFTAGVIDCLRRLL